MTPECAMQCILHSHACRMLMACCPHLPWARGRARLSCGPPSAKHSLTTSLVLRAPWLFFALAAACGTRILYQPRTIWKPDAIRAPPSSRHIGIYTHRHQDLEDGLTRLVWHVFSQHQCLLVGSPSDNIENPTNLTDLTQEKRMRIEKSTHCCRHSCRVGPSTESYHPFLSGFTMIITL